MRKEGELSNMIKWMTKNKRDKIILVQLKSCGLLQPLRISSFDMGSFFVRYDSLCVSTKKNSLLRKLLFIRVGYWRYASLDRHISFLVSYTISLPRSLLQSYYECDLLGWDYIFLHDSGPFWVWVFSRGLLLSVVLFFLSYGSYPVHIFVGSVLGLAFHHLALDGDNHMCGDFISCDTFNTYMIHPHYISLRGKGVRK